MSSRAGSGLRLRSAGKRRIAGIVVALLVAALASVVTSSTPAAAAGGSPCGANINPVACENSQTTGVTPEDVWDIDGSGDDDIQGFSTDISVNAGSSIGFKIDTTLSYKIDVYRLGYYGGNGARLWASNVTHSTPVKQPACLTDPSTQLTDCGNWSLSSTWNVPSNAVSGVYEARLTATNGDASQITFIVRNDASTADIVYQTSDPTWEAYNTYGGSDFYVGTQQLTDSQARAFKVSYNRPFATRGANGGRDFLFSNEYPTIRYLERNGYDVTYISGVDTDRYGATLLKNHKVFMSVGHDEYWSQAQRTNVENARDAGVSLMFLSGNEVYWHTRYEPSIDGSNTAYRTLVCYKETWDNAPTDPTGESTATWRDPRFGPQPGGGNPENSLTGTMYMSNFTDLAITVSGAEGKLRLWRNTGLGNVSDTTETQLAPHTIGYESDEDVDNGFRPAGLIDLSTTVGPTPQELQDFGNDTLPGTTTHHLTLYRAASGALVFGAGTIQWAWGLDDDHDGIENEADPRMQQATMNMLADMKALPTTLMSGMVMPTTSTDTIAPTATITSPAANATIANGTTITVTGTATDQGGGIVAGVEVSLDGGTTWHPATGRATWSYTGVVHGNGAVKIEARATDDSANMQKTPTTVSVTTNCPCSLFSGQTPKTPSSGDNHDYQLGLKFSSDTDGYVTGVRFYKGTGNTGTHTGTLWSATGTALATGTFTNETATGWQTLNFATPVAIARNTTYLVSYYAPNGNYSADANYFSYKGADSVPLHTPGGLNQDNGVFGYGTTFPDQAFSSTNYYVDPIFMPSGTVHPTVITSNPVNGATGVNVVSKPTVTFSTTMNAASLSFTIKDSSNVTIAGSTSYDSTTNTATFTPAAPLSAGTTYTASINGTDSGGTAMVTPYQFSFTTGTSGTCPCTIFPNSATPAGTATNDSSGVELGVKFSSDVSGVVTAVRFYKAATNTGTHTGSLWTTSGQLLGTGTFTNETASGWQTMTLSAPVSISAGTTYIASYHAPNGNYSLDANAFEGAGVDNPPLHVITGGAVYNYDTGFPNNPSNSNYWVDVVFNLSSTVVPSVTGTTPADGATGVDPGAPISATMSTAITANSATLAVTGPSGAVAGTTAYNATTQAVTFTPTDPLTGGAKYTATLSGATSTSGKPMAGPVTWSFTTQAPIICPCTLFDANATPAVVDSGDSSAVSLGVKFSASANGRITGVRFYKAANNTGTHTASIWTAGGSLIATATYTNETASGWQSVNFASPVPVVAGTTYVVSYFAPTGDYSVDSHYFDTAHTNGPLTAPAGNNGVFAYGGDTFPNGSFGNSNYWVDPIFDTGAAADTTPPSVESATPLNNAASVSTAFKPTATFSEPINASTLQMTVKDSTGAAVAGTASYVAATQVATFSPTAALARGMKYTVSVSASDVAGNAMATPSTYSFTTMLPTPAPGACPCSVWDDTAVPAVIAATDSSAVELGTTFTSDVAGQISGVRFYKAATNTGTHKVSLWSAAGDQLATATATNEVASGWQTVNFATPVSITAGTKYLVSYNTTVGNYSADAGAFATVGVDKAPLHVPVNGGAYIYGSGFPNNASATNYWVDPVLQANLDTTPPTVSAVAATGSGTSATVTWTTDEASTSRVDYGTSATALTLSATTAGSVTSHSVALSGLTANTKYYYRVTSADAAGNSTTSPAASAAAAVYTPTTVPFSDASTANFAAGAVSSSYVTSNGVGDVVLAPAVAQEFSGTALPSGWTSTNASGGSSTVTGGSVNVLNASLTSSATYSNGRSLEVLATLGKNQSIGWATSSNANVKMSFSVNASNQLIATVNDGLINNTSGVAVTGWTAVPHKLRIEWTSSSATFYVDDVQKYTHGFVSLYGSTYRPLLSDTGTADGALGVDWLRVGPYAASGTFTSRVFDAGTSVTWAGLSWVGNLPSGTGLTVKVRTGNTPTPDGTWGAFTTVTTSGASVNKTARYLQYQVTLTSGGSRFTTPTLSSVSAAYHL